MRWNLYLYQFWNLFKGLSIKDIPLSRGKEILKNRSLSSISCFFSVLDGFLLSSGFVAMPAIRLEVIGAFVIIRRKKSDEDSGKKVFFTEINKAVYYFFVGKKGGMRFFHSAELKYHSLKSCFWSTQGILIPLAGIVFPSLKYTKVTGIG